MMVSEERLAMGVRKQRLWSSIVRRGESAVRRPIGVSMGVLGEAEVAGQCRKVGKEDKAKVVRSLARVW